ncbi:MAG: hypothetical protein EOM40_09780 [Clostridia bacterium]|nr:hypothetical protein [Clostridia bacterium]
MESPDYQAEMQKLFAGKVRYAVEAFICCWTQAVHVAIESGMDIRFSAALLQNYMARLYESETVNETLDLNSQYLLELASNIAKL